MENFRKLYLVGVLTLGCTLLALLGKSSFSQTSSTQSSESGRFQLVSHITGTSSQIILLDTKNGRMWAKTAAYSPTRKAWEVKWVEDGPFLGRSTAR